MESNFEKGCMRHRENEFMMREIRADTARYNQDVIVHQHSSKGYIPLSKRVKGISVVAENKTVVPTKKELMQYQEAY